MVDVRCRSNLDLHFGEEWPRTLPTVAIGHKIESKTVRRNGIRLTLEVVSLTWKAHEEGGYYAELELHLPKGRFENIAAFQKWYQTL